MKPDSSNLCGFTRPRRKIGARLILFLYDECIRRRKLYESWTIFKLRAMSN